MSSQTTSRRIRRTLLASLIGLGALSLHACADPCRNLAAEICYCLPDDGTRAACNQEASDNENIFPVSGTDAAYCQKLIDTHACDCNKLTTAAGKAGCGISYPTD